MGKEPKETRDHVQVCGIRAFVPQGTSFIKARSWVFLGERFNGGSG
jgi:hypothetical protein